MSKKQFIKNGNLETGHRSNGKGESITFLFTKSKNKTSKVIITAILEADTKDDARLIHLEHELMDDCVDALIEWLQENK